MQVLVGIWLHFIDRDNGQESLQPRVTVIMGECTYFYF
jgi:hypothetical protein